MAALDQNPAELLRSGVALQRERKFLEAERIYQAVLRKFPENADALHLMGTLGLEAQEPEIAIEYFSKALTLQPRNEMYHHNLGSSYILVRNFGLAIRHLSRALELKPGLVDALCNLARCYVLMNDAELALPLYRKAQRLQPRHYLVAIGLGNALVNLGRMEEAEGFLRQSILERTALAEGYMALASLRNFDTEPRELGEILAELENGTLDLQQKSSLHHAAGKILNDLRRYEEAIDHFSRGKKMSGSQFNVQAYAKWVDHMIAVFNPLFVGSRTEFGNPTDVPIFVVGMPRSGTSLTEQILASHPHVHGAGELHKMRQISLDLGLARNSTNSFSRQMMNMTAEQSRVVAGQYLTYLRRYSRDAPRIVDKMPHNFELVGLIRLLFPNAKIIHVRRNAIDNCVSCFMNAFSESHGYNADLDKLGLYYREYDRLMQHWNRVFPGKIFLNTYEDLISSQEQQSRKLIDHIGFAWDPACFNFHETERSVATISRWQVRQPIYQSSVGRWKNYGDKLQPLIKALGNLA